MGEVTGVFDAGISVSEIWRKSHVNERINKHVDEHEN
jgi:hypothetical protein